MPFSGTHTPRQGKQYLYTPCLPPHRRTPGSDPRPGHFPNPTPVTRNPPTTRTTETPPLQLSFNSTPNQHHQQQQSHGSSYDDTVRGLQIDFYAIQDPMLNAAWASFFRDQWMIADANHSCMASYCNSLCEELTRLRELEKRVLKVATKTPANTVGTAESNRTHSLPEGNVPTTTPSPALSENDQYSYL